MTKTARRAARRERMRSQPSGWRPSTTWVTFKGKPYRVSLKGDSVIRVGVMFIRNNDDAEVIRDLNINGATAKAVIAHREKLLELARKRRARKAA